MHGEYKFKGLYGFQYFDSVLEQCISAGDIKEEVAARAPEKKKKESPYREMSQFLDSYYADTEERRHRDNPKTKKTYQLTKKGRDNIDGSRDYPDGPGLEGMEDSRVSEVSGIELIDALVAGIPLLVNDGLGSHSFISAENEPDDPGWCTLEGQCLKGVVYKAANTKTRRLGLSVTTSNRPRFKLSADSHAPFKDLLLNGLGSKALKDGKSLLAAVMNTSAGRESEYRYVGLCKLRCAVKGKQYMAFNYHEETMYGCGGIQVVYMSESQILELKDRIEEWKSGFHASDEGEDDAGICLTFAECIERLGIYSDQKLPFGVQLPESDGTELDDGSDIKRYMDDEEPSDSDDRDCWGSDDSD